MGFVDGFIKQLTQPADDENEFYDGADESSKPAAKVKPQPVQPQQAPVQTAQPVSRKAAFFERQAPAQQQPEPEPAAEESFEDEAPAQGGIFSALGLKVGGRKHAADIPQAESQASEPQVILLAPRSLQETRDLRTYIIERKQTIVSLDSVGDADARRILDYMSGMVYALDANITQVSTRAFIVTPGNVNIKVSNQS